MDSHLRGIMSCLRRANIVGEADRPEARHIPHLQRPSQRRDRSYSGNGSEPFDSLGQQRVSLQ